MGALEIGFLVVVVVVVVVVLVVVDDGFLKIFCGSAPMFAKLLTTGLAKVLAEGVGTVC